MSDPGFSTTAIRGGHDYRQCNNLETNPSIVTSNTFFQADPTNLTVSESHLSR